MTFTIENTYARYEISADGKNLRFIAKPTGTDYCAHDAESPFAQVKKGGEYHPASAVSLDNGRVTVRFGESAIIAELAVAAEEHYFTLEVLSVAGEGVEELIFANVPLTLQGTPDEEFACCALALNLQTNVPDLPGPNRRLWAACYPRFGFAGAKVALIACPQGELRTVMQEVVSAAPDLPHSPIGGPWALGQGINEGSYLFNFGGLTAQTADKWIDLCHTLGFNQIDLHGGNSFRFGDCRPNPCKGLGKAAAQHAARAGHHHHLVLDAVQLPQVLYVHRILPCQFNMPG